MKKQTFNLAVLASLFLLIGNCVQAQVVYPDTTIWETGDTIIIYRPWEDSCMTIYQWVASNPNVTYNGSPDGYYNRWEWYRKWPNIDSMFLIRPDNGGMTGRNNYAIEGFAQPYHFDDTVIVIGVMAQVGGTNYCEEHDYSRYFRIFDTNFNELAQSQYWIEPSSNHLTYFFPIQVRAKDFYLCGDENPNTTSGCASTFIYKHTVSVFDTIWRNYTEGCQSEYHPYLKKDGKWISFADDTVYQFLQNTWIALYPVLLHPLNDSARAALDSLAALDTLDTSSLFEVASQQLEFYPNPANEVLIIKGADGEVAEVFDHTGKLIFRKRIHQELDIKELDSGTYILKIANKRGVFIKK